MELLERFAAGDLEAFETLFRQFQYEVYRWIVRIVRDPATAEDLTIETFWRIYRSRNRFDPSREFGPWARRIATNVALSYLKSAPREHALLEEQELHSTSNASAQSDLSDSIMRAFARLPAKLQVTAVLALVEERPYDEIAQALGAPVGTVKARVFRAVRLLRKHLQGAGVSP
jgi:RNA polymerase sigma-70 factor (ECF subfamily)